MTIGDTSAMLSDKFLVFVEKISDQKIDHVIHDDGYYNSSFIKCWNNGSNAGMEKWMVRLTLIVEGDDLGLAESVCSHFGNWFEDLF